MKDLCIECKTKPIYIKSRGLCTVCAQRYYRSDEERQSPPEHLSLYRENKVQINSEVEFIKNFFKHSNWLYHPAHFRLNGSGYQPDFYDGERNTFIEVAGTRQAFYKNRDKYRLFLKTFPKIKFEIRYTNGDLIPFSETEGTFDTKK